MYPHVCWDNSSTYFLVSFAMLHLCNCGAVVISTNFDKGALGTTTPIVWVWSSYNHAHIFKDGNMII